MFPPKVYQILTAVKISEPRRIENISENNPFETSVSAAKTFQIINKIFNRRFGTIRVSVCPPRNLIPVTYALLTSRIGHFSARNTGPHRRGGASRRAFRASGTAFSRVKSVQSFIHFYAPSLFFIFTAGFGRSGIHYRVTHSRIRLNVLHIVVIHNTEFSAA